MPYHPPAADTCPRADILAPIRSTGRELRNFPPTKATVMDTSEKQIKRIVLDRMERCSVCHRGFEPDDVHVLSRKSDMWMLMVSCGECQARNFVAAVIGDGDAEEAQLALRRLGEEHVRARVEIETGDEGAPGEPVSVDDVIEMHQFLQGFDGDFLALFRDP